MLRDYPELLPKRTVAIACASSMTSRRTINRTAPAPIPKEHANFWHYGRAATDINERRAIKAILMMDAKAIHPVTLPRLGYDSLELGLSSWRSAQS